MKTVHGLDFDGVWLDDEWQIWTPDMTGGVIGSGETFNEALADAVANMEALCAQLRREIRDREER